MILSSYNTPLFAGFRGILDSSGTGMAQLNTLGPIPSLLKGINMHFAYAVNNRPWKFTSRAVSVLITE